MNHRTRNAALALAAAVVVTGHVLDKTTGQPLTDVAVSVDAKGVATAHTDGSGRYALRGVSGGKHTLTLSSDDVPPQHFDLTVGSAKTQRFDVTACSTTLDYSCAGLP